MLTIALIYSGSAVIAGGWYANVYDVSALLMIAVATRLLFRERARSAGVVLGVAFFCKETAVLALPFLLMLFTAGHISRRQLFEAALPAVTLGAIYFAIRSTVVPFGGAADVHGFAAAQLLPTVINLAESFWRQTLKGTGPQVYWFVFLAISLASLRRPGLIVAALLFLASTVAIYWGMFSQFQDGVVIHHLNFVGRLYLVPAALMLCLLALERRTITIAVLCLPIVLGGVTTWRDHARFQGMYRDLYRAARDSPEKSLTAHFPDKSLDDPVRGIVVGNFPEAAVRVNAREGRLERSR